MIFDKRKLEKYKLNGDYINILLKEDKIHERFMSHKWLVESLPKQAIYNEMYGDLLGLIKPKKNLDVGGGFCLISEILITNHEYHLLDIMAHDDHDLIVEMENKLNKKFWINKRLV